MAFFLKMQTIPGESKQKSEYMDVDHWAIGADLPAHIDGSTGGLVKGESNIHELQVTVKADKATIELMKACLSGRNIAESILEGYKDAGGPKLYYKATFKDGVITMVNYGMGGANQMGPVSLSLKFNVVEKEYTEIGKNGEVGGKVKLKFNAGTHEVQ